MLPHETLNNTNIHNSLENISGLVERVTYHNLENGFCVLRIQVKGRKELVTVVGHIASISASCLKGWLLLSKV